MPTSSQNRARTTLTRSLAAAALPTAIIAVALPSSSAQAAGNTVVVSGTAQLQAAIKNARPGQTIELRGGTYTGPFFIRTSGRSDAPITMRPYSASEPVRLTADLPMPSCGASGPDGNRTIKFQEAASWWTIEGLTINNGVYIAGKGVPRAYSFIDGAIRSGDWQKLRAIPGRGSYDPNGARNAISAIARQLGTTLQPIDGVKVVNNTITGKGIHVTMSRYGTISGNSISNVKCGVGPAVWLGTFSDGWQITNNSIDTVAPSTHKHYMQEGIRIDNGSNYNNIAYNTAKNLPGDGRAFTTDQAASFNVFRGNVATNVAIGFNDQMAGWSNQWLSNTARRYRDSGFSFRMMDAPLKSPSMASSPRNPQVACNVTAEGSGPSLEFGAAMSADVRNNTFQTINLAPNLRGYWVNQSNTYQGRSALPPTTANSTATCSGSVPTVFALP